MFTSYTTIDNKNTRSQKPHGDVKKVVAAPQRAPRVHEDAVPREFDAVAHRRRTAHIMDGEGSTNAGPERLSHRRRRACFITRGEGQLGPSRAPINEDAARHPFGIHLLQVFIFCEITAAARRIQRPLPRER